MERFIAMPRKDRIVLPHYPHNFVQRGNSCQAVFLDLANYLCYLATLEQFKAAYGQKVYAFCLMTNHAQLLAQPSEQTSGMASLMKRLSGHQTSYRNKLEGRSSTLWESRFSSPVPYRPIGTLSPANAILNSIPSEHGWFQIRQIIKGAVTRAATGRIDSAGSISALAT